MVFGILRLPIHYAKGEGDAVSEFSDDYDPRKDPTISAELLLEYEREEEAYDEARGRFNSVLKKIRAHRLTSLTEMPECSECSAGIVRNKCALELDYYSCPRHEQVEDYGGSEALMRHFKIGRYRQDLGNNAA